MCNRVPPERQAMEDRAQEVADALRGTPKLIHEETTEEERNCQTFCAALDTLVFECAGCGWWCATDEECNDTEDGPKCDDCKGEENAD